MKLHTWRFGELEIVEDTEIVFIDGIPGFPDLKRFVLIGQDETAITYLQSTEDGDISFILTDPFQFYPEYDLEISEEDKHDLKLDSEQEVAVWSIITVQDSIESATLNLLAPVIINLVKKLGKQIVLHGTNYKTKHPLIRELPQMTKSEEDATC